jgi:hypothetical protein
VGSDGSGKTTIPRFPLNYLVICDPLHLLKRIRYRFVRDDFSVICPEDGFSFTLAAIAQADFLSPVVFTNSRESKMHDSLPLELFSARTLVYLLENEVVGETMMIPWCLLVVVLTFRDLTTRQRIELLEVGFWNLILYRDYRPEFPRSTARAASESRPRCTGG